MAFNLSLLVFAASIQWCVHFPSVIWNTIQFEKDDGSLQSFDSQSQAFSDAIRELGRSLVNRQ
jgi:hypothetical protein